jgi:hypothetical protein
MDHTNHVGLASNELTPDTLEDATIYDADNNKIGTVSSMVRAQAVRLSSMSVAF